MLKQITSLIFTFSIGSGVPPVFAESNQLQPEVSRRFSYDFGQRSVGSGSYHNFYLTTRGGPTLINRIYTFGEAFQSLTNCPRVLYPGRSCIIRLYFQPTRRGLHTGQTFIKSSKGTDMIYLRGYAN